MDPIPVFAPASPLAHALSALLVGVFAVLVGIFLLVTTLVIYMIVRYRDRPGAPEARQIFGWNALEVTWTLIPAGILAVFSVFMVAADRAADPLIPPGRKPDLEVIGHQWWWEINYVASGAVAANEIHIPIGKSILIELKSADVIHDFWAPELGRKIDAVPGHPNTLWIEADAPGTYLGTCAEFCGVEHAWMRFRVIAQNEADFDTWQRAQLAIPPAPSAPDALAGAKLFADKTCINCHSIAGTAGNQTVGPDLTHIASRTMLAGEAARNTPEELFRWLKQPDAIKPQSHMPDFKLTDDEAHQLVAYLEGLK
ncbi:MAG TPA: cytochrome c oxidase subunit II [Candidatus Binataceae bacterium]|nr:cytochrome c oxidase subunit II [Candidatus Binataceae bacterium]